MMDIRQIAYPRQVILVTSEAEAEIMGKRIEKSNIMAASWHMPASFEPLMYAIAVGKQRFSYELIKKSKVFCVNFMPFSLKDKVLFCGRKSGRLIDKFKESGLTPEECEKIHCKRIKEALAYIECEVINEVEAGDHVIFIGKAVNLKLKKEGKRVFQKGGDIFTTTED
ncbi:MAG: flavin reductase family protein [Candidatus Woesearchaeota archaeon]|nr:flavin reductase family protein [Candidatus Woesearchaeota archaeon]